ncbi:unnamed protein product [Caenorhabditis auriculariae]|uniref:Uncharacterized protein n=1 Tax=Caenorhabditis auriculariae TaxID=2777116 RepID=A0A8S1H895_9PELO|nr:unnamed protein product [Caenorhabditis auriculariae]
MPQMQLAGYTTINVPMQYLQGGMNPYMMQNGMAQMGHPMMQQMMPLSPYGMMNPMMMGGSFMNQAGVIANSIAPNPIVEQASYLSLINDKENFQTSGCSWDLAQLKCTDAFGLCKGGCRDFAVIAAASLHDCR